MKAENITAVVLLAPLTLLYAWTLGVLYRWFVAPLGAPELSLAHLYGLSVFVTFLIYQYDGDKDREALEYVIAGFLKCGLALGIGWVCVQIGGGVL